MAGAILAAQERTFAAERSTARVRLAVIVVNTLTYAFLADRSGYITWLALAVLAVAWVYGVYVCFGQPYRRFPVITTSYYTSISDAALITTWLAATGGFSSPYFVLWYVSIVAIAFRYDFRTTIAASCVYCAAYTGLVLGQHQLSGHLVELLLRLSYIFLVGALGGEQAREAFTHHRARIEAESRARALEEAEVRFRAVAETAKDSIITIDEQGLMIYANGEVARVFGYSLEELRGRSVEQLLSLEAVDQPLTLRRLASSVGEARPFELLARHKDGHAIPLEVSLASWETAEGTFYTAIARDIRDRRRAEDALTHQALYDPLTELANRRLFRDRAQHALRNARRHQQGVAFLLMDLDFFKDVNDTFGHSFGDLLLKDVAERLRASVRDTDTIARLGGDEFAVLLEDIDGPADATITAEKILRALADPFLVQDESLSVAASVGIALSPRHGSDAETLLRRADVAMYAAKSSREGIALYDALQDENSAARLSLLSDLRQAIDGPGLVVHYQPKVTLEPSDEVRLEVLARWNHPSRGEVGPDEFIPLAERSGLIGRLTERVLTLALEQCQRWQAAGLHYTVAVNLSVRNLHDPALPETILRLLERFELPPDVLGVEVTESTIMAKPGRVLEVLSTLSAHGIAISIDDFGTGYSSLAYLKRLPAGELKIDKSFVVDMSSDENDAVIVRSTIEMAHNLGLRVVAEGVEDATAWNRLRELGCDEAQGFLVARPMPADAVADWTARWLAERPRAASSPG
ncbi:MAG: putative bifunctional diguanylate cyclase/phosphodiesterase [Chloroflexota bacterium]